MTTSNQDTERQRLTSDQAQRVARLDAETAYRDLSIYRIQVSLDRDGWHVDDELKDREPHGGGPRHVTFPTRGKVLSKQYERWPAATSTAG